MDRFVGEIALFAFAFAPDGWLECNGSLLSIFENQVLFSLIGPHFGGDGMGHFAVPDLRKETPCEGIGYFILCYGVYPQREEHDQAEREYLRGSLTPATRYRARFARHSSCFRTSQIGKD